MEIFGQLPEIQVYITTMGNPCMPDRQAFNISPPAKDLSVIRFFLSVKIKPVIFGSEQAVTMGSLFEILPQKMDFPVTVFVYSLKTKPASFGLVHKEKICSFMMEKHLPF